ncbi:MAG: hypothetical protein P8P74_12315 [Crocinitomicaceae bacterium]|nr:hypothetical protein [Crocinitomicaceae bacterium]
MNAVKTDFRNEQEMMKHLFQALFQIQIRLEKHQDPRFHYYDQIKEIIDLTDALMQVLMDLFDS